MHYNTDNSIKTKAEDRLNRERLVHSACQAALTVTSDTSFVIGIKGEWGLGKTSFMNLMVEELEARNSEGDADENLSRIITIRRWRCTREKKS